MSRISGFMKNAAAAALAGALCACTSAPFSYAEDRCVGSYNQCQNTCASARDGGARSACLSRCLASEDRCYTTGADGTGASLSQESLVGYARSEKQKQADYERWRAARAREAAQSGENDVDIEIVE